MKLLVIGAGGRMGRMLVKAVDAEPQTRLSGALERAGAPGLGQDPGTLAGVGAAGLAITDDLETALVGADGILDFTAPEATLAMARIAGERGLVHIIGTTGFTPDQFAALREVSRGARVVQSGNMSLGVNLLASLVRRAARSLGADWDIEVLEMHHRMKVDAPSGTALLLGEAAASGRGIDLGAHSVRSRDGQTGARPVGDIGFATLRGGTVIGDHSVIFAGEGERIELAHRAEDRGLFARGAIRAALWVRDQPPGYYTMSDVLGLAD
ncbi:4-hydroxy-tetrahydrodipicolinate reductase [Enterovirga rhinocerotis]|nr:4-hydroxy-tetrahydrodipicolinate reductase [Enterovirga rhinocerotis]